MFLKSHTILYLKKNVNFNILIILYKEHLQDLLKW